MAPPEEVTGGSTTEEAAEAEKGGSDRPISTIVIIIGADRAILRLLGFLNCIFLLLFLIGSHFLIQFIGRSDADGSAAASEQVPAHRRY